ncbi:uncharacterized protein LOC123677958 isoform X2 [Harmonia axyridis]|uniref:uncharacterized protein LOC123677958 isoform X2 n=1 Tax=Harmonia axyridis TaxID=115357 RepID=UPI001E275209|nr:uncharacterized protein LOC123677958 isoform X2 [Harmonia axyridis]
MVGKSETVPFTYRKDQRSWRPHKRNGKNLRIIISLDPDDENSEPNLFQGLKEFLENDLSNEERNNFFNRTLPNMVNRALKLKEYKPKGGLHFSLQQQPDFTELDYDFVSSLIANAFFSTFPRRTNKSHPTLRNFNFSNFFESLDLTSQKSKLEGILHYFDWLEKKENCMGRIKIMRQVMSGKEWLTIEDWLECSLPLCSVQIKHDGKLERAEANALKICFSSSKIGENVLNKGASQESINLITFPEILSTLLNVESLEDNEVLTIENVRHITRINDPKNKASLEKLEYPYTTSVCCMDADDYTKLPIGQYEEDNILRELNKCLLAFQQRQNNTNNNTIISNVQPSNPHKQRRLSPIGESKRLTKEKRNMVPLITEQSCSTTKSDSSSVIDNNNICNNRLQVQNNVDRNAVKKVGANSELVHNRRGRFIVLGSSGECLPVTRRPLETMRTIYSSFDSSDEEFHSAQTSLEGSEEESFNLKYSIDLDTSERRHHFAKKLKNDLKTDAPLESSSSSSSYDSSFAVGISVTGSGVRDENIKVRREGSTGFALREDSLDECFLQDSLQQEKKWIDKFKNKHSVSNKRESNRSSEYSFSSEYSSELEELYEQFSKWLEDPILETERGTKKELDNRELAVVKFAGSLLKRTLSESFAGVPVPLTEEIATASSNAKSNQSKTPNRNKLVLNAKSLSLELARHKHRLAAQLIEHKAPRTKDAPDLLHNDTTKHTTNEKRKVWFVTYDIEPVVQTLEAVSVKITLPKASKKDKMSQIAQVPSGGLRPIATGNWGCGSSRKGDVQIKVIIQWLAASVAGVPSLIYFTCGHQQMSKLDTVCRILLDRKWCVKDLTKAILKYSNHVLHGREISGNLFQELISHDRSS